MDFIRAILIISVNDYNFFFKKRQILRTWWEVRTKIQKKAKGTLFSILNLFHIYSWLALFQTNEGLETDSERTLSVVLSGRWESRKHSIRHAPVRIKMVWRSWKN